MSRCSTPHSSAPAFSPPGAAPWPPRARTGAGRSHHEELPQALPEVVAGAIRRRDGAPARRVTWWAWRRAGPPPRRRDRVRDRDSRQPDPQRSRRLPARGLRGRPGTGDRLRDADPGRPAFVRHHRGCDRPVPLRAGDHVQRPFRAPPGERFAADAAGGWRAARIHPPVVPRRRAGAGDGDASAAQDAAMRLLLVGALAAVLAVLLTATVVLGYRNE